MSSLENRSAQWKEQNVEKLFSILKICQKMNSEKDLSVLLDLIANEATKLMEADRASIFILDKEENELWSQVAIGSDPVRFSANLGIAGATVLTGQTNNVNDVRKDPRFYSGIDSRKGFSTRSVLAVPLKNYEDEITGVFEVLNKKGNAFSKEDEEILKALASQVAVAIEAAQHVQELNWHQDKLLKENKQLFKEVKGRFSTKSIIGSSDKIQRILRLIKKISDSSVNVLITGESGTGKELFAKALHYSSSRAHNPFVALNCAALPDNLVESELFGIEKGVATGVEKRIGRFETADGGTLFLDEIGDLSLTSQAKILRVLQEGELERVGSTESIKVDVRILAATNKDLEKKIKSDAFREDLFYRLKVIHIHTPSLREMREDIPLLANYFLDKQCREMKKEPKKFSPGLLKYLSNYSWPGNIRELENEVKSLVVLSHKKIIGEEDLSENIVESDDVASSKSVPTLKIKESVEDLEKKMILEAMKLSNQNQIRAAEALGLSRQGLSKKIKRYSIDTSV